MRSAKKSVELNIYVVFVIFLVNHSAQMWRAAFEDGEVENMARTFYRIKTLRCLLRLKRRLRKEIL